MEKQMAIQIGIMEWSLSCNVLVIERRPEYNLTIDDPSPKKKNNNMKKMIKRKKRKREQ